MVRFGTLSAILCCALLSCARGAPRSAPVTQLAAGAIVETGSPSAQWPTYGHDDGNQRYSSLVQITVENVGMLVPAYVVQTGVVGSFEASPIVTDGIMYVPTPYDGVVAVDASTGSVLWRRPPLSGRLKVCCGPAARGVALADGLVVIGQLDGVLVALDRRTGGIAWAKAVANNAAGYSMTMAPLIVRDSVIIGVGGSEFGIRGWLSSYALRDGRLRWRWYATDPQHWFGSSKRLRSDSGAFNERTSATRRMQFADSWRRGGGGIWTTPAFDATTNTLYVATGNPWPDFNGRQRPGDNLFTDCLVALDASTGKMRWYFQVAPHDTHDHDVASPPFLFDSVDERGRHLRAVGEAAKDGIVYILDRDSGRLVRRSDNVVESGARAAHLSTWEGGTTWSPVSFDPALGYAIVTAAEHMRPGATRGGDAIPAGSSQAAIRSPGYGTVSAVDVATGKIVWRDLFDEGLAGGSVSTAGGVTFVGEGSGFVDALDTRTGRRLWHFETGAGVNAPPVAFESKGREYVAVASGGNQQLGTPSGDALFAFTIGR